MSHATRALGPPTTGTVTSKDGTTIAYDRAGQGPPVIVVVGALCSRTLGPGVKLAPLLAERFTVFTYDRRGRGASGDVKPYAPAREVEDLAALVAVAGGRASLFGHSSGAVLALDAAEQGIGIDKLALYEPPLVLDASRPSLEGDWAAIAAFIAEDRRDEALGVFLRSVGVPAFVRGLMRFLPIWKTLRSVAPTLPHDGALVRAFQRGEPLPATAWRHVGIPALALAGGKSPPWMLAGTRALAAHLAAGEHRVVPGQAHDANAKVLAPLLASFLG
jgi:pimeloyl-ACP methyl ester carboxylesterase